MRIALCTISAGAPRALAATSFIGAFAEGLETIGQHVRIISLNQTGEPWYSQALGFSAVSTPWIDPPTFGPADLRAAARADMFSEPPALEGETLPRWYREVLLEREFASLPGDGPGIAMVYPRSLPFLDVVSSVTRRIGWGLLVFATEALTDEQIDPGERERYIRRVVEDADCVWAVSEYLARFWEQQGVPASRIVVSPPPVRGAFFAVPEEPAHPEPKALYVGNLAHREIGYLLEIAESVRERVPGFSLAIHGDATADQLDRLSGAISAAGLRDVIALMPPVPIAELPALLRTARVLLLPRAQGDFSQAGFPNKLGEYLSSGRPVVVTAVGDIPRYLVDGESALLVSPDGCADFADAVVRLLGDDELAQRIGHKGREVALAVSCADVVASKVLDLVLDIEPLPAADPRLLRGWIMLGRSLQQRSVLLLKKSLVRMLRAAGLKPPPPDTER